MTYGASIGRTWRSAVVLALVAALAVLPLIVRALPAGAPGGDAAALLARMRGSFEHPYSGYAESTGSLALPESSDLGDVASLLGQPALALDRRRAGGGRSMRSAGRLMISCQLLGRARTWYF